MQTNLDRNISALNEVLAAILVEQSKPGFFGKGSLRWSVKDGVIQAEVDATTEPKLRIKKAEGTCTA